MTAIGRNAPCPCGSGLKYKKCCLLKKDSVRPSFTAQDRERALGRLLRLSDSPEFATDDDVAMLVFWADSLDERSDDEVREVLDRTEVETYYKAWFMFDVLIDDEHAFVDVLLDREGHQIGAGERAYLTKMRDTHVRLYEVVDVALGQGLGLIDLWSDTRLWVRERAATKQLARWDVIAARLAPGAGGDVVIDGGLYRYPPLFRDDVLTELRRAHQRVMRGSPDGDLTAFFKRIGAVVLHQLWLDLVMFPPRPEVVTPEGDSVVVASAVFDVRDRPTLERALAAHPDIEAQRAGNYLWLEDAPFGRRGLGTVTIKGKRAVFEAMSRERAERGREFLEGIAGHAVSFRIMHYEDLDQARTRLAATRQAPASASPPSQVPPEVEAQILGAFYDRHYKAWLNQPIPALGDRTPRHAARLKTVRPRVVALIKELENGSEHMRRAGRPAYDFGWMWSELGLERP